MTNEYKICSNCVMDNSDQDLILDENGLCDRCREYKNKIEQEWNYGRGHEKELDKLISDIKKSGAKKKYDCILGLSGGLDSSYLLHLAVKEWGLRPFVFHIDAGWNLPVAESNLKKMTDKLNVELHVEKLDYEEMREMQLAWFRTGFASLDVPQDHAFISVVDKFSKKLGVKYILNGYNIATEIIADPASWDEDAGKTGDGKFVKDVVKHFCNIPIKKYVYTNGFKHKVVMPFIYRIKTVKPLNLIPVTRQMMIDTLKEEYDYQPYGQKHFENLLTKFLEAWWLPNKFGYDIRRSQLSSLILTKQITREEALNILKEKPINDNEAEELFNQVCEKLKISKDELMDLYKLPRTNIKFKNSNFFYKVGLRLFEILGLEKRIRH